MKYQKVQTLIRRCVGDAAAGLGLHFLHLFQGPFSRDAGHMVYPEAILINLHTIMFGCEINKYISKKRRLVIGVNLVLAR